MLIDTIESSIEQDPFSQHAQQYSLRPLLLVVLPNLRLIKALKRFQQAVLWKENTRKSSHANFVRFRITTQAIDIATINHNYRQTTLTRNRLTIQQLA
jgi:hypothetical protein